MRILHVITALGVGGAERMLLKLLSARALSGMEQRVVAMLPGGAMAEQMRTTGARVDECNFLGRLAPFSGGRELIQVARRFTPDLVQGWLYHGNLGAALVRATLPRRVPLVWGIRQSLSTLKGENVFARVAIQLNKIASRYPDRILFNSQTSLSQHRARGFAVKNAECVPNGFEVSRYAPNADIRSQQRTALHITADTVAFGLCARYHPSKDHAGFVRAARLVRNARPATCFVMAGTGVDANNRELMQAIHEAGLEDRVHLLGEQRDIAALLSGLDVYVSSSARIEAFSNSVGEAMSCALPCVVTQVGDSPTVVGETGRVVPPSDHVALADAMIAMVDLGKEGRGALGEQARRRIVSEFDIEAVAERYAALYRDLTASRREH